MPNTVMGAPYPLPTEMVRDGAAAIEALAHTVPVVQTGGANNRKDVRVWADHGGYTTNQWGLFYVTPAPNLATIIYANAVHLLTSVDQEALVATPYYDSGFGKGPTVTFAVRHAGQATGWIVNSFVVFHILILGV